MIASLFPHYRKLVSIAIAKADTRELQTAAVILIDHLEEDYTYMQLTGKAESIQELRDQLQAKHDELDRELKNQHPDLCKQ